MELKMFGTYARNVIAGQGRYVPDREPTIHTIDLRHCEYNKNLKILKVSSEIFSGSFPSQFFVRSHHTNKEVMFVPVGPQDRLFDQDGWDGEQQIYRPIGNVPNVDYMVIYHTY
jgi:hypothetical protein